MPSKFLCCFPHPISVIISCLISGVTFSLEFFEHFGTSLSPWSDIPSLSYITLSKQLKIIGKGQVFAFIYKVVFFSYLNSNSILSVFHCCITNHPNLGCKTTAVLFCSWILYIRNSERASVFESRTAESSCGNVQKPGSDLSGWVLGAGCFIHMSGGWAEWSEDLDCHQCLHMASSCVLGFSQSGSWISEEASGERLFYETEAEASRLLPN